jgi:alginate O-acetyltransferase complex protein AlgI
LLFNSFEFILLFLPVTFFVYFFLNKNKLINLAKGWLVFCSLFFYSYWNIKYLALITCSMIFNYSIGTTLNNPEIIKLKINRKAVLIFGITCNILLLGYYKYYDFFVSNFNHLLKTDFNLLNIILPLGISFFTFTQVAYLVDAYKETVKEADFINYALFVTYFPHLIAGPIIHHKEMMPQFNRLKNKVLNYKNIYIGIVLFAIGLFKKVIIADNLSPLVHQGFDISPHLSFVEAWMVSMSYTLQLYFDFSGYTDMALGISAMFNIFLPQNFNSPYKAQNLQDFWRRWHITLSRFLKDYIYIPLGGNRIGEINTYRNLLLTFLIGGLWHGAAWTFIIWGAFHGIGLIIHRFWQKLNVNMPRVFAIILTFIFVNSTFAIFRATNITSATKVLKGCFDLSGFITPQVFHGVIRFKNTLSQIPWQDFNLSVFTLIAAIIIAFAFRNSFEIARNLKPKAVYSIIIGFFVCWILLNMNRVNEFLYFNF